MVKIAHIADCHIDAPISGLPARLAAVRRQALRGALRDAVDTAAAAGAQIVLLAGDVFDRQASPSAARLVPALADKYPHIRFFLSPGNHDSLFGQSVTRELEARPNLHVFGAGGIQRVALPGLGCAVYGHGCPSPDSASDLLNGFRADEGDGVSIMCLHAQLPGFGAGDYDRVSTEDIAASGLDYLALGHIHARTPVSRVNNTFYAYSGCLAAHGFDECGPRGFYLGDVGRGSCSLEFVESTPAPFVSVSAALDNAAGAEEAAAAATAALAGVGADSPVRLTLTGTRRADFIPDAAVLEKLIGGFEYIRVIDDTAIAEDIDALAGEQTLRGMLVKYLNEAQLDEATRRAAISAGLAALAGEAIPAETAAERGCGE